GKGPKVASVSTSAPSDRMIPVVSSDQDMVKVETRSPLVSPARRSSVTAPRAAERLQHVSCSAGAGRGAGCYVGARGAAPDSSATGVQHAIFFCVPPHSWSPTLPFHMTSPKASPRLMKLPACPCKD